MCFKIDALFISVYDIIITCYGLDMKSLLESAHLGDGVCGTL